MTRARSKLAFGDPDACLQLLADTPPDALKPTVDQLRAKCIMKAGDCNRGRAITEAAARAQGYDAAVVASIVRDADFEHCPLDAGPRDRWAPRARQRMVFALYAKTSCKPVLAFVRKHALPAADPIGNAMLEARCLVQDGECNAARAALRRGFASLGGDATSIAGREDSADQVFAASFPHCK